MSPAALGGPGGSCGLAAGRLWGRRDPSSGSSSRSWSSSSSSGGSGSAEVVVGGGMN